MILTSNGKDWWRFTNAPFSSKSEAEQCRLNIMECYKFSAENIKVVPYTKEIEKQDLIKFIIKNDLVEKALNLLDHSSLKKVIYEA